MGARPTALGDIAAYHIHHGSEVLKCASTCPPPILKETHPIKPKQSFVKIPTTSTLPKLVVTPRSPPSLIPTITFSPLTHLHTCLSRCHMPSVATQFQLHSGPPPATASPLLSLHTSLVVPPPLMPAVLLWPECLFPKSIMLKSYPHCDDIRRRSLWEVTRSQVWGPPEWG